MATYLFDQQKAIDNLKKFFQEEKAGINSFGSTVNQTFEAYTLAQVIEWYKNRKWDVKIINPSSRKGKSFFRLKFSTRGVPDNYSYAVIEKDGIRCQVRHQLRVSTRSYRTSNAHPANICCDVVVLKDCNLGTYSTSTALPNDELISFAEVKHMSAFAELIAGFLGVVHELQPDRLKRIRIKKHTPDIHIASFLNVSGVLNPTAKGLEETIKKRRYDIDVYSFEAHLY